MDNTAKQELTEHQWVETDPETFRCKVCRQHTGYGYHGSLVEPCGFKPMVYQDRLSVAHEPGEIGVSDEVGQIINYDGPGPMYEAWFNPNSRTVESRRRPDFGSHHVIPTPQGATAQSAAMAREAINRRINQRLQGSVNQAFTDAQWANDRTLNALRGDGDIDF